MAKHLTDEDLGQCLEGEGRDAAVRSHLEACAACRERLREAEGGLELAREAGLLPEPAPAYWQAFRLQVGRLIEAEPLPGVASSWRRFAWPGILVPAAVAALLLILPVRQGGAPRTPETTLAAWEALPVSRDDGSLDVLRGLALSSEGLDAAALCRDVADCLSALTDEESLTLAEALRERLPEDRS